MRLFFFTVFIGLNVFSQKIYLGDITGYQNSSLDTLRQEFHVYLDDRILTIDLFNFEKRSRPIALDKGLSQEFPYFVLPEIWVQNEVHFLYPSGGLVYRIENDTIKRIDHSFDHNMQYGTSVFEHEGTIFKYGGYGFWSDRDFFTYYDKTLMEWEVYHPIKSEIIPKGRYGHYYIKDHDKFHVFGGTRTDPDNRRKKIDYNEAWSFDFKNKEWLFLGTHDKITEPFMRVPYQNKLLLLKTNGMTVIDIDSNTRAVYEHSPISAQITENHKVIYHNAKFYLLITNTTGSYLNIIDEAEFFGETIEQSNFYKNQAYWLKRGGIFFLVMLIIILIFWLIKKNFVSRNKIKLLDNGLRYHLKFTEFDQESMAIIRLLLNEEEVSSSKILQIVEKPQYSPAHNERIKVQKIKDINIKISALLRSNEDMITSFKSSQDRRIRLYKIHRENFDVKGMTKHRKT